MNPNNYFITNPAEISAGLTSGEWHYSGVSSGTDQTADQANMPILDLIRMGVVNGADYTGDPEDIALYFLVSTDELHRMIDLLQNLDLLQNFRPPAKFLHPHGALS